MKKFLLLSFIFLLAFIFNSDAQHFNNGDNVLSPGVGFGSSLGNYTYSTQTPAISLQYEHGNWDVGGPGVISLGGYLGYKSYSNNYADVFYGYTQKWTWLIIGLRSAYHFNMINAKNVDLYGGLMLSYNILTYKYSSAYTNSYYENLYHGSYGSGFSLSLYIGGRYYFTDNVAAFLELGYGISNATIGASFRL
jgi:hypothetical protein